MKTISILFACACVTLGAAMFSGCGTTPQTVAYQSLYSVGTATTGAYDGYVRLVIDGNLPTNDVPTISRAYNAFQGAFKIAVVIAQGNTNAIAPLPLVNQGSNLVVMITKAEGAK